MRSKHIYLNLEKSASRDDKIAHLGYPSSNGFILSQNDLQLGLRHMCWQKRYISLKGKSWFCFRRMPKVVALLWPINLLAYGTNWAITGSPRPRSLISNVLFHPEWVQPVKWHGQNTKSKTEPNPSLNAWRYANESGLKSNVHSEKFV